MLYYRNTYKLFFLSFKTSKGNNYFVCVLIALTAIVFKIISFGEKRRFQYLMNVRISKILVQLALRLLGNFQNAQWPEFTVSFNRGIFSVCLTARFNLPNYTNVEMELWMATRNATVGPRMSAKTPVVIP